MAILEKEPNYRGLKVTLAIFVALCANGDHSKMRKEHMCSLQSLQVCNSKSIKYILMPF